MLSMLLAITTGQLVTETTQTCTTDTDCEYRCCTYTKEHEVEGDCVEIDDFDRCSNRKTNYHIVLYCFMVLLVGTGAICCWIKKKENTARRQALQQIKIEHAHEEKLRRQKSAASNAADARSHRRNMTEMGAPLTSRSNTNPLLDAKVAPEEPGTAKNATFSHKKNLTAPEAGLFVVED